MRLPWRAVVHAARRGHGLQVILAKVTTIASWPCWRTGFDLQPSEKRRIRCSLTSSIRKGAVG
jgi:hypothetical protein